MNMILFNLAVMLVVYGWMGRLTGGHDKANSAYTLFDSVPDIVYDIKLCK